MGLRVCMQAMAASVLLRGLLFASVHQAPRRWLPLRKSAWGVAQQGIAANLAQLRRLIWAKTGSSYAPGSFPWQKITFPSTVHGRCCMCEPIPSRSYSYSIPLCLEVLHLVQIEMKLQIAGGRIALVKQAIAAGECHRSMLTKV